MQSQSEKKLKILVGYHKTDDIIEDEVFMPIHLGRSLGDSLSKDGKLSRTDFQWLCEHMIGDDTGENISALNRYYCELTGIYWAWKNYARLGNPEYIGSAHYRRLLSFLPLEDKKSFILPYLSSKQREERLNTSNFLTSVDEFDAYIPPPLTQDDSRFIPPPPLKKDEDYNSIMRRERAVDVRAVELRLQANDYIQKKWPQYYQASVKCATAHADSKWNIFIFKREIFFSYCEFIFDVLSHVEGQMRNIPFQSIHCKRSLSFLGEWLTGVFICKIKADKTFKIKELQPVLILNTIVADVPLPAYSSNNVPVFLSTDNRYFYDCAITIQSIIANSTEQNNYDIFILWYQLTKDNREKLLSLKGSKKNVSIRLFYIGRMLEGMSLKAHGYFSPAVYFRLFAPIIFRNIEKIIYLDSDTICVDDLAKLYVTDIGDNWIAGCHDCAVMCRTRMEGWEDESYYVDDLKISSGSIDYFNSGVLIFNVSEILKNNVFNDILRCLENQRRNEVRARTVKSWVDKQVGDLFLFVDQDILNLVCRGHVLYLDLSWNVMHNYGSRKGNWHLLPEEHYETYLNAKSRPRIIHFSGKNKPKNTPNLDLSSLWWFYARQCPLYEEIIYANIQQKINDAYAKARDLANLPYYLRELRKYQWLTRLTFGQTRRNFEKKKKDLEAKVKRIENLIPKL